MLVPKGETYTVSYKSFDDDNEYTDIEIPNADGLINFDFTIVYELPKVYTLDNVYFDTGKATLKPSSYRALDNLAAVMINKSKLRIEVAGHTDNEGAEDGNLRLSQARAESVRAYVSKKGVDASRMIAKGYGESRPIASNETPEGRQKTDEQKFEFLLNNSLDLSLTKHEKPNKIISYSFHLFLFNEELWFIPALANGRHTKESP